MLELMVSKARSAIGLVFLVCTLSVHAGRNGEDTIHYSHKVILFQNEDSISFPNEYMGEEIDFRFMDMLVFPALKRILCSGTSLSSF